MITITERIVKRVQNKGRGFAFTAKDFLDLGSRTSVDVALASLAKTGKIRRVCRGVYDYPSESALFGDMLAPDFDQVAHAIGWKRRTAYEGIVLLNKHLGYGLEEDKEGCIRLVGTPT